MILSSMELQISGKLDLPSFKQYQISILHIVGHPEGEKNEKCVENSFKEIIAKSLPKLWKKIDV